MANFIFSEGAAIMSSTGLDWVNVDYDCALVDDSVAAAPTWSTTWTDIEPAAQNSKPFANKAITSFGACAADPLQFTNVSTVNPDGRFIGFVIKRNSDDKLVAWFDSGFTTLGIAPAAAPIGDIMNMSLQQATYTFTLRPGINNEEAWFRP